MRIIKFFIFSVLLIGIVVGAASLVAREVLLYMGTSAVKKSLAQLHSISRNRTEYVKECRKKGANSNIDAISGYQVRFLNAQEYVVEVVCTQFPLEPLLVSQEKLPPFVKKNMGSSGIIWGLERSAVTLEIFGRRSDVVVENEETKVLPAGTLGAGISPVSSCSGYGYMCCQDETHVGVGDPYTRVNDCVKSCYSACAPRPIILSFMSDPYPNGQTRTLKTVAGQPVTFSYVSSFNGSDGVEITLDFGDGQQETFSELTHQVAHTYSCPSGGCTFTATVQAKTTTGVTSAVTNLSQLTVEVGL